MEIADLKAAWQLMDREILQQDFVDEQIISETIYQKPKTEIAILKRALRLKFIIASISIVIAMALAILTLIHPEKINPLDFVFTPFESSLFFGIMALSISVMVLFNYRAFTKLDLIHTSSFNLKTNLGSCIEALETAIKFNIYSDAIMTPIVSTWIYYAYAYREQALTHDPRALILILLPCSIGVFSYFLQGYLQQLKFGNYLSRLKTYLIFLQKNND